MIGGDSEGVSNEEIEADDSDVEDYVPRICIRYVNIGSSKIIHNTSSNTDSMKYVNIKIKYVSFFDNFWSL